MGRARDMTILWGARVTGGARARSTEGAEESPNFCCER